MACDICESWNQPCANCKVNALIANARSAAEAETAAAIVAMVKDARDSCVFAVRTKDNTRERDGAVDALNGILRKIARGDHAKGGG